VPGTLWFLIIDENISQLTEGSFLGEAWGSCATVTQEQGIFLAIF
jgi:hypothetical protein